MQKIEKTSSKNDVSTLLFLSSLLSVVLSLRDVPKSILRNRKGGHGPPRPPVVTALNTRLLLNVKRQMPNLLRKKPMFRKNRARSFTQILGIQKEK